MGGTISSIANSVTQAPGNIINSYGSSISDLSKGNLAGAAGNLGNAVSQTMSDGIVSLGYQDPSAPSAPGVDPSLQSLQDQQVANAQSFRQNIPQMQQQMTEGLKQQNNNQLSQSNQATKTASNQRGLLNSNINEANQQQNRSSAQTNLATGISNVNTGLQNAASTLDQQALSGGVGIQQTQQQIQNDIYSQQQAALNANNSTFGSLAGLGLMAAIL